MFAPTMPLTELDRSITEIQLGRATCDCRVLAVCVKVSNSLGSQIKVADVGETVEVRGCATYCRCVPQMKVEDEHCEFLLSFPAAHFPALSWLLSVLRKAMWTRILRICASLQAGYENVNLYWRNPRVPTAS